MINKLGKHILRFFDEEETYQEESMSLKTFRSYHSCHSLQDYFPYESYEDGIYYNRSTLGFTLECLPIMGFTEESHKQLAGLFQYVLPENSNIQFLLIADPYIGGALSEWKKVRAQTSEMLHKMAHNRMQAFKELAFKDPIQNESKTLSARFFRLLISVTLPHQKDDKPLSQLLGEVKELKERLEETLKMVGLHAYELPPELLMSFIDDIFFTNLKEQDFKPFVPHYNILDPIRFQTLSRNTSIQVKRGGLVINEKEQCFRAYQVSKYPRPWSQMQMRELIGSCTQLLQQVPFPFFIHYGVHIPKQEDLAFKMMAKASHLEKQIHAPIAKHLPSLRKEWEEYQFVKKQIAEGHRFVRSNPFPKLVSGGKHLFLEIIVNGYYV